MPKTVKAPPLYWCEKLINSGKKIQAIGINSGNANACTGEKGYENASFPVKLVESTGKMAELLAASDLVFSRSGGSTAAELSLFGNAAVFIPYPYAAEGHQTNNARYFESSGAALLIENSNFTVESARGVIMDFLQNREKYALMGKKMQELSRPMAAEQMIEEISMRLD